MTDRATARARVDLAVEVLAPLVAQRVRAGTAVADLAVLVVDTTHPWAGRPLAPGEDWRLIPGGGLVGLVPLPTAWDLVRALSPDLGRQLATPAGHGQTWVVSVGTGGSVVIPATWVDVTHTEAQA